MTTSPPTTRGEQAKNQLIQAAIAQFGEHGMHATTRDIAAQAGQNIAAITYYFGSKEALYLACARWIAHFIYQHFQHIIQAQTPPDTDSKGNDVVRHIIHDACRTMAHLMTMDDTLCLSKFVSREQLSPTQANAILHEHMITPMHEHFTQLIACYTGRPASDTETILHVHALVGSILGFRLAQETILMRCGWHHFNDTRTQRITHVIMQQVDFILQGLTITPGAVNNEKP